MNNKKASDTKARPSNKKPLDQQTTYHFDGRSFVVQPVFKEENANTLDYDVRGSNDFHIREFGKRILNILKYITMLDLRNRKLASASDPWCLGFMLTGTTLGDRAAYSAPDDL